MTIPVDQIIAYEAGELDSDQTVELFQTLIDTGAIYSLQGSYQRFADRLVREGFCTT
jgi:hypothetical protein